MWTAGFAVLQEPSSSMQLLGNSKAVSIPQQRVDAQQTCKQSLASGVKEHKSQSESAQDTMRKCTMITWAPLNSWGDRQNTFIHMLRAKDSRRSPIWLQKHCLVSILMCSDALLVVFFQLKAQQQATAQCCYYAVPKVISSHGNGSHASAECVLLLETKLQQAAPGVGAE